MFPLQSSKYESQAIRSACMTMVATMAIQSIVVRKNDTPLAPEIIRDRLYAVPILVDAESFARHTECTCTDMCDRCSLKGTLKASGRVFSDKLGPQFMPGIPITDGGIIDLDWVAIKGYGLQGLKFSATTVVLAKPLPRIIPYDIEDGFCAVFQNTIRPENCTFCDRCKGKARVLIDPNNWVLSVESVGHYSEKLILKRAFLSLAQMCKKVSLALGDTSAALDVDTSAALEPEPVYLGGTPPSSPKAGECPSSP